MKSSRGNLKVWCFKNHLSGRLSCVWRRRLDDELSPSLKHRLQQSGKSQSTSGSSPPQSENKSSRMNSLRRLQTEDGIRPTRLLFCSKNSFNCCRSPDNMEGICPVSLFPFRYKSLKIGGSEYSRGIDPLSEQLDI
jgi:hypothetical protein